MAATALKQLTAISKRRALWAKVTPASKIKTGYTGVLRHAGRAY